MFRRVLSRPPPPTLSSRLSYRYTTNRHGVYRRITCMLLPPRYAVSPILFCTSSIHIAARAAGSIFFARTPCLCASSPPIVYVFVCCLVLRNENRKVPPLIENITSNRLNGTVRIPNSVCWPNMNIKLDNTSSSVGQIYANHTRVSSYYNAFVLRQGTRYWQPIGGYGF